MSLGQRSILFLQFGKQAGVLYRDHRLVGEGLQERDLLVRERLYLPATEEESSDRRPLTEERRGERRPMPEPDGYLPAEREFGVGVGEILDVNRSGVHDSPASHPVTMDRIREPNGCVFPVAVTGGHPELIPFDEQQRGIRRLAEPAGVLDQRVQHRLQICRGARDDPENLARRGLLREGFAHLSMGLRERPILLPQLGEQPHILNGNDGLVGEGLQQGDLLFGEQADHRPRDGNRAYGRTVFQHGYGQGAAGKVAGELGIVLWVPRDVGDIHHRSI
jgi:hypothetical protein